MGCILRPMKSPFPGMDPYLESRWSDVHVTLIAFLREAIQPSLPAGLRARAEERILLEEEGDRAPLRSYRSEVAVVEGESRVSSGTVSSSIAVPEPFVIEDDSPFIDRFVKIIDVTNGNRVVTAIEVLGPGNK